MGEMETTYMSDGYYTDSIQEAIDEIPDIVNYVHTIYVTEYGLDEDIVIRSKMGSGEIILDFSQSMNYNEMREPIKARISVEGCQCRVRIMGENGLEGELGVKDMNEEYMIRNYYSNWVSVENMILSGNASKSNVGKLKGIYCYGAGNTYITGCGIWNVADCVSSNYLNNVYMTNNLGLGERYGAIAWRGSSININGDMPNGRTGAYAKSMAGNINTTNAVVPAPVSTTTNTTTKAPTTVSSVKTKTYYANDRNYYLFSGYNRWATQGYFHYGKVLAGKGYGSPVQQGAWFFGSTMRNDLTGKTIKSIKVTVIRNSGIGNPGPTKVTLRMHKHSSQPTTKIDFSSQYKEVLMSWGETKTIDVTTTFKDILKSGSYYGFAIVPTTHDVEHYVEMNGSIKVTVSYV